MDDFTANLLILVARVLLALAVFTVVATLKVHAYWRLPDSEQLGRSRIFTANLAIIGGLLLLAAVGGGKFSLMP